MASADYQYALEAGKEVPYLQNVRHDESLYCRVMDSPASTSKLNTIQYKIIMISLCFQGICQ
jgi:hypothetical protein